MNVRWLGHSSFLLTESTGTTVVTDPYHPYVGIDFPDVGADLVTISHTHDDHNNGESVKGNPVILNEIVACEIKGIHVSSVSSMHDEEQGELRGDNIIFKFRIDGINVCHMGDIGEECSPELVDAIGPVNVLLIPVGGNYTIDAEKAKEYVDRLMPDIVIPMHYRTKGVDIDIDKVDAFLKEFDEDVIEYLDTDNFDITRSQLDDEYTRVIVPKLEY